MTTISTEDVSKFRAAFADCISGLSDKQLDMLVEAARSVALMAIDEASRAREAELAQNLFKAQLALNQIGNLCGIASGMSLVTAVPKLVQKMRAECEWLQEQVAFLSGTRDQLTQALSDASKLLENAEREIRAEASKMRQAAEEGEDRLVKASDLPVPEAAPTPA